jgi:pimeloyl-ACP methyl ester carboxylesterase
MEECAIPEDAQCTLCFSLLWKPMITPCQHKFCSHCLKKALLYNSQCPVCRAEIATPSDTLIDNESWEAELQKMNISEELIAARSREIEQSQKTEYQLVFEYGNRSELIPTTTSYKKKYKWTLFVDFPAKIRKQLPPIESIIKEVKFNINPGHENAFISVKQAPFELERSGTFDNFDVELHILWNSSYIRDSLPDEVFHNVVCTDNGVHSRSFVKEIPMKTAVKIIPNLKGKQLMRPSTTWEPNVVKKMGKPKEFKPPATIAEPPVLTRKSKPPGRYQALYKDDPQIQESIQRVLDDKEARSLKTETWLPCQLIPEEQSDMICSGYLPTSFGKLFAVYHGMLTNNKLVLFIHGSGSSSSSKEYIPTIHELAVRLPENHDYLFLAVDCPGYGTSTGSKQSIRSNHTEVIKEVIKSLGFKRAYALYGCSQGGAAIFNSLIEDQSITVKVIQDRPVFAKGKVSELRAVKRPVLLMYDEDDDGHPIAIGRLIAKNLPNNKWVQYSSKSDDYWWSDNFPKLALEFLETK